MTPRQEALLRASDAGQRYAIAHVEFWASIDALEAATRDERAATTEGTNHEHS